MASKPKRSKWYATTQTNRTRKMVSITLSDEARARLKALAKAWRSHQSTVVETLIMGAKL